MESPLDKIENEKAQYDIGVLAARIFQGALDESESIIRAFLVTAAWVAGMGNGPKDEE